MKRSKIFLVTTAALLAIVGVFASKVHKFIAATTYYYKHVNLCTRGVTAVVSTSNPNDNPIHNIITAPLCQYTLVVQNNGISDMVKPT